MTTLWYFIFVSWREYFSGCWTWASLGHELIPSGS